jgi:nitrate reductase beta subunit
MDVRSQISMVFHLDKCIGCHTCSIACKNIWTDRKGAEYMWWNNVETKPGTGYPGKWEDQEIYKGGWEQNGKGIKLKGAGKRKSLTNIFHNPHMPVIDDYYEPFTYKYLDLIESPAGDDQPTARPISMITGEPMDIKMGPNWDDDLSGSPDYARNDPNLEGLSPAEQEAMFEMERMAFFYLPRICNHCLNPACVAACPSGAIYKRGEDGVVLINQDVCRGWRMCVTACPYKKTYYNWSRGGPGAGLHALVRGTDPLPGRHALRRRPDRGGRLRGRGGGGAAPDGDDPRSLRPRGHLGGEGQWGR